MYFVPTETQTTFITLPLTSPLDDYTISNKFIYSEHHKRNLHETIVVLNQLFIKQIWLKYKMQYKVLVCNDIIPTLHQ